MDEFFKRLPNWLFGFAAFGFVVLLGYSMLISKEPFYLAGKSFGAKEVAPSDREIVSGIPSGAVMAFDMPSQCPEGWTPFVEGQGRALVGASFGMEDNLFRSQQLTSRKYREHGGDEEMTLHEANMPPHRHATSPPMSVYLKWQNPWGASGEKPSDFGYTNDIDNNFGPSYRYDYEVNYPLSKSAGGSADGSVAPHPNMPPYIALYFCKKD